METRIVHASEQQRKTLELIGRIARSDAEILISGPSGVGKELYAEHAHRCSRRASRPFVAVNCANLSPEILENEIFGHAKGAFTGASAPANGIAAAADGGTLFLDEVDTLPLASQAKILRFAELKEYRRLGESFTRRADIRLIAASNADLGSLVNQGTFRADLYYRLRVAPVEVTALAERPADIPVLIAHFTDVCAEQMATRPIDLTAEVSAILLTYHWPGNVRELQNCIRYLTCLQLGRPVRPDDLPRMEPAPGYSSVAILPVPAELDRTDGPAPEGLLEDLAGQPMNEAREAVVEAFELDYLDRALSKTHGNVAEAARRSGKNRRTMFQLIRKHGLSTSGYRHLK